MGPRPAQRIGVFDSGLGGLTVLRSLRDRFPRLDFVYLGDTARVPYGPRSPATIERYSHQCAEFLLREGCTHLVVACNTASAYALPSLHEALEVPVSGVIRPSAKAAAALAKGHILVLATRGTRASGAYPKALHDLGCSAQVTTLACPLFVALAEEGLVEGDLAEATVAHYLSGYRQSAPDCIVLGCTHFPLLRAAIEAYLQVPCVESGPVTAEELAASLSEGIQPERGGELRIFLTDESPGYAEAAARFLGAPAPGPQVLGPDFLR